MAVFTSFDVGVGTIDKSAVNTALTGLSGGGGRSATNTITAHAGGLQASAVALTTAINNVTVVASPGDSVALPSAVGGQVILVTNSSATSMNVFSSNSSTTDTINGTAGTTAYAVAGGTSLCFISPASGVWRTMVIGGGATATNAITAHAGGTQAPAVALVSTINNVTVVGTAGDSVALPSAVGAQVIYVTNSSATSMNVFSSNSSTTDTINGTVGTTAFAIAGGVAVTFISPATGVWRAQVGA